MSAEPVATAEPAQGATGLVERLRQAIARHSSAPNPIWMREMRQSARLTRTPFVLMSLTIIATMIIAGVGGSVMQTQRSDAVGQALFHTFFSLAFFVVAWAGPAVAANAIASEREGRTWEAVVLTGMSPKTIARGKFLSAFTAIASYVVMLAPVGALCFLFGGVDFLEVLIGYVYLFALSALFVAFGLAISSKLATSRGAIMVTLLLSVPASATIFGTFGPGLGQAVHGLWERVPSGAPVWLPMAYVRGELGVEYVLLLFVVPFVVIAVPAWFLYESTVANLTEPTDDRSSGLKRWFIGTTLVLVLAALSAMIPLITGDQILIALVADTTLLLLFVLFCVSVFMGEPLAPSRRVRYAWDRSNVGRVSRWLGPGMEPTFQLVLGATVIALALVSVGGLVREMFLPRGSTSLRFDVFARFVSYFGGFTVFVIGLGAWLRARSTNLFGQRIVFGVILGGLAIVPWIIALVLGIALRGSDATLSFACASPLFGFVLLDHSANGEVVAAGFVMSVIFAGTGFAALGSAFRRARGIVRAWEERQDQTDAAFAAEDAALEAASRNAASS
ncbi:MAG: ABC transporter permease [Polyangiaceae bacterium]|nr:ABC transporter permease [Polyangiaceae bacterium]